MYDPVLVQPMREEVTELGFQELKSAQEVDAKLKNLQGTALLFVNSVCGCAAGGARPALRMALSQAPSKPTLLLTVFAGMEREAAQRAREYLVGYPPSSPMIALLKDGDPVFVIERHHIEGNLPEQIASSLKAAMQEYC